MALFTGFKFGFGKDSAGEGGGSPFIATGGTEVTAPDNSYKYWVFESSGAFTVSSGLKTIDYLVIGGGGAGGRAPGASGGGGGAGGWREGTKIVTAGSWTVTVGTAGAVPYSVSGYSYGGAGGESKLGSPTEPFLIFASGGGGGGAGSNNAQDGGSGGGGAGYPGPTDGGATVASPDGIGPTVQGHAGGVGPPNGSSPYKGGGGGGAGGAGAAGPSGPPFAADQGGVGKAAFSGDTGLPASYGTAGPTPGRYFAGGGGGGYYPGPDGTFKGGDGGGGAGGAVSVAVAGIINTGSGGGGGMYGASGAGATGIVIIRCALPL